MYVAYPYFLCMTTCDDRVLTREQMIGQEKLPVMELRRRRLRGFYLSCFCILLTPIVLLSIRKTKVAITWFLIMTITAGLFCYFDTASQYQKPNGSVQYEIILTDMTYEQLKSQYQIKNATSSGTYIIIENLKEN